MFKKIALIISAVLIVIVVVQGRVLRGRQKKINKLSVELIDVEKQPPRVITITETTVETEYIPGKTIVKERVPDGYVRFDLEKYRQSLNDCHSLQAKLDSLKAIPDSVRTDTTEIAEELDWKERELRFFGKFVKIQQRGWLLKPIIGVGYTGKLVPVLGLKLAFWRQYNFSIAASPGECGVTFERYLGDIIPPIKNARVGLLLGLKFNGGYRLAPLIVIDL